MKRVAHILIVGHDRSHLHALGELLVETGIFRVCSASSASEALALIPSNPFAAIILDMPPDSDAPTFCVRLRQRGVRTAIIVLSDSHAEADMVDALHAGAIDYIVKPFRGDELRARLRAHIRQHESSDQAVLMIGPYHFRPGERVLFEPLARGRLRLTQKEADVLKCLYRAAGQPVSRDTLLRDVWGYQSSTRTHTVETHLYRLRRKLERKPWNLSIIVSGAGGYRLDTEAANKPASPSLTAGPTPVYP